MKGLAITRGWGAFQSIGRKRTDRTSLERELGANGRRWEKGERRLVQCQNKLNCGVVQVKVKINLEFVLLFSQLRLEGIFCNLVGLLIEVCPGIDCLLRKGWRKMRWKVWAEEVQSIVLAVQLFIGTQGVMHAPCCTQLGLGGRAGGRRCWQMPLYFFPTWTSCWGRPSHCCAALGLARCTPNPCGSFTIVAGVHHSVA